MIGFSSSCFDEELEESEFPLYDMLSDVHVRNTGNMGTRRTEFRGTYDGKEVIMVVGEYILPSHDEIRMGIRNWRSIASFDKSHILKISIGGIEVRTMSLEDFNRRFKNSNIKVIVSSRKTDDIDKNNIARKSKFIGLLGDVIL